jgi:hypothetical protein
MLAACLLKPRTMNSHAVCSALGLSEFLNVSLVIVPTSQITLLSPAEVGKHHQNCLKNSILCSRVPTTSDVWRWLFTAMLPKLVNRHVQLLEMFLTPFVFGVGYEMDLKLQSKWLAHCQQSLAP